MKHAHKVSQAIGMLAGISFAAFIGFSTAVSAAGSPDDGKKTSYQKNAPKKSIRKQGSKRIVKIIRSGKPVEITEKDGHFTVGGHRDETTSEGKSNTVRSYRFVMKDDTEIGSPTAEAVKRIKASLAVVEDRLAKARKKPETDALKAAQHGLTVALNALSLQAVNFPQAGRMIKGQQFAFIDTGYGNRSGQDAAGDHDVQVEIFTEVSDFLDGDQDIDQHTGTMGRANESFGTEAELKALKKAEKELGQMRLRLEKRLMEKKAAAAKANKGH